MSSLQLIQPSLLRMETRIIVQALRLHRTKFTDQTNMKQQYVQRVYQYIYVWTDFTKRRSIIQERNEVVKKQTIQAIIQQKNEQLISANVPEDQMVRVYQNAYDDLSDMVAAVYFNHYLESNDLVEKKAIDQEVIKVFRNQNGRNSDKQWPNSLLNKTEQCIWPSTMKKDTNILCNSGNEYSKEFEFLSKRELIRIL